MRQEPVRFRKALSKLEPVEFLTDVKHWRESDLCGTTALAAITGKSIEYITHVVMQSRGSEKPVTGMTVGEIINILGVLGYRVDMFDIINEPNRRLTVKRYWMDRGDLPATIIHTPGHFMAFDCFGFIDTHTNGQLSGDTDHPCMKQSVLGYMEVRKMP